MINQDIKKIPFDVPSGVSLRLFCQQDPRSVAEECKPGFGACENGECIPDVYFCDGHYHCLDASDEFNCSNPCEDTVIQSLYFTCSSNTCIAIVAEYEEFNIGQSP